MLSDEEKIQRLERAVMSEAPEQVRRIYGELGEVSLTARALGAACLCRGLDVVKVLVECGASFSYPDDRLDYHKYSYYRVGSKMDYSLVLIDPQRFAADFKAEWGAEILPISERVRVIDYLCENADKTGVIPEKLLYYSIRDGNAEFYEALKNRGVSIGDDRKWLFRNACNFSYGMDPEKFQKVFGLIARELDGEKIRGNQTFYHFHFEEILTPENFEFILEHFDKKGMNQSEVMKKLVDKQAISCLEMVEKAGWLKYPKKRDELIQYAADNGRAEAAAWLLEFRNRTADLAAEREKAEKKAERELNAAPDSVTALKQLWSYKKREDGTLSISKYKGNQTVVNVPEKIGKSIVTNIESGVLACSNVPRVSAEQTAIRKRITKIILPKTLRSIGFYAFLKLVSLEEINLPEGLHGITTGAFKGCRSLKSITIPGSAKKIGDSAFSGCSSLKNVVIEEGVEEIGEHAFEDCGELESIDFPRSVGLIVNINKNGIVNGAFPKLTARVFKGSYAEQYCLKNGIKILYK